MCFFYFFNKNSHYYFNSIYMMILWVKFCFQLPQFLCEFILHFQCEFSKIKFCLYVCMYKWIGSKVYINNSSYIIRTYISICTIRAKHVSWAWTFSPIQPFLYKMKRGSKYCGYMERDIPSWCFVGKWKIYENVSLRISLVNPRLHLKENVIDLLFNKLTTYLILMDYLSFCVKIVYEYQRKDCWQITMTFWNNSKILLRYTY